MNRVLNTKISRAHPLGRNKNKTQTNVRATFLLVLIYNKKHPVFLIPDCSILFYLLNSCQLGYQDSIKSILCSGSQLCWMPRTLGLDRKHDLLYHWSCCVYPKLFPCRGITSARRGNMWKCLQKLMTPLMINVQVLYTYDDIPFTVHQHGILNFGKSSNGLLYHA